MKIQDIMIAVRAFDKTLNDAEHAPDGNSYNGLFDLLEKLEAAANAPRDPDEELVDSIARTVASEKYAGPSDDNIEVDDDAAVVWGAEGAFVAAWLWVSAGELEK